MLWDHATVTLFQFALATAVAFRLLASLGPDHRSAPLILGESAQPGDDGLLESQGGWGKDSGILLFGPYATTPPRSWVSSVAALGTDLSCPSLCLGIVVEILRAGPPA